jgi:cytochrome c-type biogenesis protein CcmH/NrfG
VAQPARPSLAGVPTRRLVAVLLAALAGAVATVAVTAWTATDEPVEEVAGAGPSAEPLTGRPPLLVLPVPEAAGKTGEVRRAAVEAAARARPDDVETWLALAGVEMELERREESAQALERAAALAPDDARVEAARLTLAYDPADPQPTIDALSALAEQAPEAPLVRFQLGVAQLWAGHAGDAQETLVALRDSQPEGLYKTAADDLLHPGMAPGYPPYFTSFEPDDGGIDELQAIAEQRPSDVEAQLQLGAALQAAGRRDDAAAAYARALTLDPDNVEAQVARAVNGFSKDDPSGSFAILGPLARDNPRVPAARFHLAVALLWLRDFERARAEFRQVEREAPGTRLARLAGALAARTG